MIELVVMGCLKADLQLDQDREQWDWHSGITDVATLIDQLCTERAGLWSETLHQENLLISVNQTIAKMDHPLADGDQVTFFPPLGGG
jgi:molybdopterin converting factor small subunit